MNFLIIKKDFGTTLQNKIFSILEKLLTNELNFISSILLLIFFDGKIILFKILFLELTKKTFVSELPISPKMYIF
tara:strand:- start:332 stop:556 length:225 start_codon:yes stop_codon:yes gene_type:complete